MTREWKRKGDPTDRPALFCPKCDRCLYTKDDMRSYKDRGFCERCSETASVSDAQADVVTIVIRERA